MSELICVEDPSSSLVADGAQTLRRANFVRQQLSLDVEQNNLTWHKYLSLYHHNHLPAGQSVPKFYFPPVQSFIGAPKLGTENDVQKQSHPNIITEGDDDENLLTSKSAINGLAIVSYLNHAFRSSTHRTVNLSLTKSKQKLQFQELLLFLLAATSLICLHNASSCSGFSLSDLYNNLGPSGNNHPIQPFSRPQSSLATATSLTRRRRFFNDDPLMGIMDTVTGSFSQDPSVSLEPPGQTQSSWTSILNPFGLLGGGQRPQQPSPGGVGDDFENHIKRILVPRVSGTPGNVEVRQYLMNELRKSNFHVELDEFTGSTPVGKVNFANIIASSNPDACRQLVLACHYDSKMMDGFLGAIDSAVPCAMLLKMSATFSNSFRSSGTDNSNSLGLKFIFFDGEEAYVQWSQTDSLYGSRHLAAKWAKQPEPPQCGSGKTELDKIELFVLLDLIGTSDTSFVMYNTQLKHHYEALQRYERAHLSKSGLTQTQARRAAAFKSRTMPLDFVEDDHVPFRKRGVPILLLLAHPFPRVWHTVADNYDAIDFPKTRRILHVLEEFVSNYSTSASNSSN